MAFYEIYKNNISTKNMGFMNYIEIPACIISSKSEFSSFEYSDDDEYDKYDEYYEYDEHNYDVDNFDEDNFDKTHGESYDNSYKVYNYYRLWMPRVV